MLVNIGGSCTALTETDTLTGIENVIGGSGDDPITGDGDAIRLRAVSGDDVLDGGAGGGDVVSYASYVATSGTTGVVVEFGNVRRRTPSGHGYIVRF